MLKNGFPFPVSRFPNGRSSALHYARRVALLCVIGFALSHAISVAMFAQGTTAQGMPTTAQTDTTLYTLTGSVVNSMTGEPIVRALVQIMGQNSPRAAFTDREGNFRFANMNAMTGQLMAVKPGYYGNDQGSRVPMAMTRVTIGPDMQPVVIKLVPESGISGQITDDAGDPLEGVNVNVSSNQIQQGRMRTQRMQQAQTDEQGEFHMNNLPPGNYVLSAGPVWSSASETGSGHAQMFFPGVSESSQATPIQVVAGQSVRADLTLPTAKTFQISGVVTGSQPGFPQVVNQSGDTAGQTEQFDPATGKFIAKVTCNICTIKARSGFAREFQYGEVTVNLNGDKNDIRVPMSPVSVPVDVQLQSSKPDFVTANGDATTPAGQRGARRPQRNGQVFLRLISLSKVHPDAFSGFGGGPDNPEMFLQNVEFGKYMVEVQASGGGWYVASVRYGSTNLDDEPIDIEPGPAQPIEIVMKDDVASLSGTVQGNDVANASATVIVAPQRASARVRSFPVTGNGTFSANNLAPGLYKVYAFDTISNLEYANPEAMKQYSSGAVEVTLDANGTGTVTVPLTKRAQP
jgi:hypothetical protein